MCVLLIKGWERWDFHPVFSLVWLIQHPQRPKSCPCTWAFRPVTFPSQSSVESQPVGLPFKAAPLFPRPALASVVSDWLDFPASCFLKSWFFFGLVLYFCCLFNVMFLVLCVKRWGKQALSPKTAAQAFLDDPHHSVWAGREGRQGGQHEDGEGTAGVKRGGWEEGLFRKGHQITSGPSWAVLGRVVVCYI